MQLRQCSLYMQQTDKTHNDQTLEIGWTPLSAMSHGTRDTDACHVQDTVGTKAYLDDTKTTHF